ncbi:hypothetical protein EDB89DRAFT_1135490 [Lactarius sanguifluus]|nr:hypothetical protein EDB89DRAFT_1135490 [Lactarius sanguifluus]
MNVFLFCFLTRFLLLSTPVSAPCQCPVPVPSPSTMSLSLAVTQSPRTNIPVTSLYRLSSTLTGDSFSTSDSLFSLYFPSPPPTALSPPSHRPLLSDPFIGAWLYAHIPGSGANICCRGQ